MVRIAISAAVMRNRLQWPIRSRKQSTEGLTLMCNRIRPWRKDFVSLRTAAWLLNVSEDDVCRMVRTRTLLAVRRRSQVVIPTVSLTRLMVADGEGGRR
ncbi:hypothetical protein [Actinoalloteichus caeruleus]|uniref:hypothetical protein n=1 Tax=Actinoalloteichus cyanogriseus TaxID=2893586 RepID=UPI003AB02A5E